MSARLYQPTRTAMQQGRGKTKTWLLEFVPASAQSIEPLMGWTTADETMTQIRLEFDTKAAGLAYAAQAGLMVQVDEGETRSRKIIPKSYSDNFAANRVLRWTH